MWPFKEKTIAESEVAPVAWEILMGNPEGSLVIWTTNDGISHQMTCETVKESQTRFLLMKDDQKIFLNKEDILSIEIS